MFEKLACLPYVFDSVLACAKPAHARVSEAFLPALWTLSVFSLTLPQTVRLFNVSLLLRLVHRAFLLFDAKAWPQSQTDLFTCTIRYYTVGIPFSDA